jgi:hypothetical protein
MKSFPPLASIVSALLALLPIAAQAAPPSKNLNPYPEELTAVLGRGLIALPQGESGVFLSWRLLPADPEPSAFTVFRRDAADPSAAFTALATVDSTSYADGTAKIGSRYAYAVAVQGNAAVAERSVTVEVGEVSRSALVFDVGEDYRQARVVTGDLDGDGEPDVVVAHSRHPNIDPWGKAWEKSEDTIRVTALRHSGERLWSLDLGWGIEAGNYYNPVVVWDIDGDGRSEVLLKTNRSTDPMDYSGERLTILDGMTGNVTAEAPWPSTDGIGRDYNSNSRNYIAIAHLDGRQPSIIVTRGLYNTQKLWAYDSKLHRMWERINGWPLQIGIVQRMLKRVGYDITRATHYLPIADLDLDGKEEILWGEHVIGEGGKDLWQLADRIPYNGHPDIVHAADIVPEIDGLEVYYGREGWGGPNDKIGVLVVDKTGKMLWGSWGYTHVDGGWAARVDPRAKGMQLFAYDIVGKSLSASEGAHYQEVQGHLWSTTGEHVGNPDWHWGFPFDWNGDGVREVYTRNGDVQQFDGTVLASFGKPGMFGADLFGDQREEFVFAPHDGKIYIVFNTTPLTASPRITPLADRQYRSDLARTAHAGLGMVVPNESGQIIGAPKRMAAKQK